MLMRLKEALLFVGNVGFEVAGVFIAFESWDERRLFVEEEVPVESTEERVLLDLGNAVLSETFGRVTKELREKVETDGR